MTPDQAEALARLAALNAQLDAQIAAELAALSRRRCRLRLWRRSKATWP